MKEDETTGLSASDIAQMRVEFVPVLVVTWPDGREYRATRAELLAASRDFPERLAFLERATRELLLFEEATEIRELFSNPPKLQRIK